MAYEAWGKLKGVMFHSELSFYSSKESIAVKSAAIHND